MEAGAARGQPELGVGRAGEEPAERALVAPPLAPMAWARARRSSDILVRQLVERGSADKNVRAPVAGRQEWTAHRQARRSPEARCASRRAPAWDCSWPSTGIWSRRPSTR